MDSLWRNRSGWQLGYSLRRDYVDAFMHRQATKLRDGAQVLDLGGHKTRKRGRFDIHRYPVTVTYANLVVDKGADIQADAAQLPLADGTFDAVICAELLEHVLDPRLVLAEAFRVLKPGGCLLVTAPFLYRIHGDPYDFGRYTHHFWQVVLTQIGFQTPIIEPQGALASVLVDFVKQYCAAQLHQPFYGIAQLTLGPLHQLAVWLDSGTNNPSDLFAQNFTTGFGLVATKP